MHLGWSDLGARTWVWYTLVITMILASVSLISLVPYIYSIFSFLSPDAVVRRIGAITLRQVVKAQSDASSYRQDAVETELMSSKTSPAAPSLTVIVRSQCSL